MSFSMIAYLQHILNETRYLIGEAEGLHVSVFLQDETLKRAFVRSLEIIGEAVNQLPDDTKRKYGSIDWRSVAGMRDRLIHGYFGVDYEIVWDTVVNKVPDLQREIERIVEVESN